MREHRGVSHADWSARRGLTPVGSRFTITPPDDYLLKRDVCSYGYFHLAPNVWSVESLTLTRPVRLAGGVATIVIAQPDDRPGGALQLRADRALASAERAEAKRLITRMLRLDDDGVDEFHRVDRRWKKSGRARIFRSPTFFEDLVKTVTSCNVTWPSTVNMNRRLCDVVDPAFPAPEQLARKRAQTLRSRCGVGYRDVRLIELAKMARSGEIDAAWFEDPATPDETVHKALLTLPGIGPYAAGNMMQLLGRYGFLAIDTETIRHGREALGFEGTDRDVEKQVRAHYERFGSHRFRSYWIELWDRYERKNGPAWTWPPRSAP